MSAVRPASGGKPDIEETSPNDHSEALGAHYPRLSIKRGARTASCHMQSVTVQAARRAIGNNQLIRFHFVSWGECRPSDAQIDM
jgi:hypothetical protein